MNLLAKEKNTHEHEKKENKLNGHQRGKGSGGIN